jgi:hypothetical protein
MDDCGMAKSMVTRSSRKSWWPTFLWYDMDRIENDASNNSSVDASVFVAAVTFLPSRYLATIRDTYIDKQTAGEDLWNTLWSRLRFRDIHYIPSFVRIGLVIWKLMGRCTDTEIAWWSHKLILIFYDNLYPLKLALASLTVGDRSIGIVR